MTEVLGRGRYGSVHLAVNLERGGTARNIPAVFALKRADFGVEGVRNKESESMFDEMAILVDLDHDHIVKFYGFALCGQSIVLFLEHCPLGDLSSTVREHGAFDLVTTRSLLQQLLTDSLSVRSHQHIHFPAVPRSAAPLQRAGTVSPHQRTAEWPGTPWITAVDRWRFPRWRVLPFP